MAITVIDGYDEFDTAGLSAHGYTLGEFAAGQVTIASGGRNSTNGMRLAGGLFNTDIYKTVGFTSNVLTMRFAFYIDAQASNITFSIRTGSTVHLALQISNSDKKIRVYLGGVTLLYTLAPTLALDTWYFIEVSATIHDTTGTLAIYLNGTPELTVTGIDTLWTGSGPVTNIGWQADAGATVLIVDDLSVEPALVVRGDTRVITRFPTSDGQAGWTPSSGGTHYTLVDEPAVNPADYVVGTAAGVVDTYGIAALGVSATVIGLAACYSGHADAAGVRGVSPVVRIGSTNYTQAQTLLGVSETWQEAILQTSPATSVAFTVAEVNAAQYGVALDSLTMALFPPVRTLVGTPFLDPISVSLRAGVSYSEARYPLTNLVDGTSKTAWRSTDATVAIRLDLGYAAPISFVGVIGHNFTVGTMCSIHATGSAGSLTLPPYPLDDELEGVWFEDQVLNRLFSTRYPNCWIDVRTAAGAPTSARYWQLHVHDNLRAVTIGEIVIGQATEFDGIISGLPYQATHTAQGSQEVLEYGQIYQSASGGVLRKLDLNLTLMQEQVALFHGLYQTANNTGGRMVVVPDSRRNDIWLAEWPSLRETTFDESYLVGTHTLTLVEEMTGAMV